MKCFDLGIKCLDLGITCLDPGIKCLDLGISSSPGDGKNSEDEDTETWPVKNSELSDLGYMSYMTENEKKKRFMRCLFCYFWLIIFYYVHVKKEKNVSFCPNRIG